MGKFDTGMFGWATADLVRLDQIEPGLIARLLTAQPRLRHAIFLAVAGLSGAMSDDGDGREDCEAKLARVIRRERPRAIITHVFGDTPDGLMGALERLGAEPMSCALSYLSLLDTFSDPASRATAALITQLDSASEQTLKVINALDSPWRLPEVLKRIETISAARSVNKALAMVTAVCSAATHEVVAQAIRRLPPQRTLADIVERFLLRADRFPDHPVRGDQDIRPLVTGRDFLATGVKYRNCLRERVDDALAGRAAYAEFRGEAIIELRPLAGSFGWMLHDVHGPNNGLLAPDVRAGAQAKCLEIGIPHIDWRADVPDLRRMCRLLRSPATAM